MTDRIDTAKEREKLAALGGHPQGPWQHKPGSLEHGWDILEGDPSTSLVAEGIVIEEDARLIAAAPDLKATLAAALDALDAKDAEIEKLQQRCEDAEKLAERALDKGGAESARIIKSQRRAEEAETALARTAGNVDALVEDNDRLSAENRRLRGALKQLIAAVHLVINPEGET